MNLPGANPDYPFSMTLSLQPSKTNSILAEVPKKIFAAKKNSENVEKLSNTSNKGLNTSILKRRVKKKCWKGVGKCWTLLESGFEFPTLSNTSNTLSDVFLDLKYCLSIIKSLVGLLESETPLSGASSRENFFSHLIFTF